MRAILIVDSDNLDVELLRPCEDIYRHTRNHFILMGSKTDLVKEYIPKHETINVMSDDYNFSRGLFASLSYLKTIIEPDEVVSVASIDFAVNLQKDVSLLSKADEGGENSFVYHRIYQDKSKGRRVNLKTKNIGLTISSRVNKITRNNEFGIKGYVTSMRMYRLLQTVNSLESRTNNFTINHIYEEAKALGIHPVESAHHGLYIGSKVKRKVEAKTPAVISPRDLYKRAVKKGIAVETKATLAGILKEIEESGKSLTDHIIGVTIAFPGDSQRIPEQLLDHEMQWVDLMKFLDNTQLIHTFVVGPYPWDKDKLRRLSSVYIIEDENIQGVENLNETVIKRSELLFGALRSNEYIPIANKLGTPNLFIGWWDKDTPDSGDTFSVGIKQLGMRFDAAEIYRTIRGYLNV